LGFPRGEIAARGRRGGWTSRKNGGREKELKKEKAPIHKGKEKKKFAPKINRQ